jgi:hypothetical protein
MPPGRQRQHLVSAACLLKWCLRRDIFGGGASAILTSRRTSVHLTTGGFWRRARRQCAIRYKQLMPKLVIIILVWTTHVTFGQTAEQKALTYLANNIYGQKLWSSNGIFVVTKDSTRIWYYPSVLDTKSKLRVNNVIQSSEDKFYKIVHSDKDIFVKTKMASSTEQGLSVPFEVITKYGNSFHYTVTFENNKSLKLTKTTH